MDKKTLQAVIKLINHDATRALEQMRIANEAELTEDYSHLTKGADPDDYNHEVLKELNTNQFWNNSGKTTALLDLRAQLEKKIERLDNKTKKARGK